MPSTEPDHVLPCTQPKSSGSAKLPGMREEVWEGRRARLEALGVEKKDGQGSKKMHELKHPSWKWSGMRTGVPFLPFTGQDSGPAQVRRGKSWWQRLRLLRTINIGICSRF